MTIQLNRENHEVHEMGSRARGGQPASGWRLGRNLALPG